MELLGWLTAWLVGREGFWLTYLQCFCVSSL